MKTPIYVDVPEYDDSELRQRVESLETQVSSFQSAQEYDDSELRQRIMDLESRVSALESVPEPEPEPEPEPPVPPPVPTDDHFGSVSLDARCIWSNSYNNPADYPSMLDRPHYWNAEVQAVVSHDPEKQATKWHMPAGTYSIPIASIFMPKFPMVADDIISVQWEAFYDPATLNSGGKAFQLFNSTDPDKRQIEIQAKTVGVSGDYRILHSIRTYLINGSFCGGNGNLDQLSTGDWSNRNVHTSFGQHAPIRMTDYRDWPDVKFAVPGQWVRYTVSWDLSQSPARLKMWLDDTLIIGDPDNLDLGFILEPAGTSRGVDYCYMPQFNSSEGVPPPQVDVDQWVRNVVVWKGADIPV